MGGAAREVRATACDCLNRSPGFRSLPAGGRTGCHTGATVAHPRRLSRLGHGRGTNRPAARAMKITDTLTIADGEISLAFSRSPGPGGQNVNKVASRVTLSWDVLHSRSVSDTQRRRLLSKLAGRLTRNGVFRIASSRHRTQAANRRDALQRFTDLVSAALKTPKPRRSTAPTSASRTRRLAEKRRRSRQKSERRGRTESGDD